MELPSISEITADLKRCAEGLDMLHLHETARALRVVLGNLAVDQARAAEEIRLIMEATAR